MATLKEKIGYGFGDMSSSMFWKIFSYYLPIFYSDIFGLSLVDAGVLMLVTRIWDAVSDPMMGIIADRTKTRWGKYRPYLLWMAAPFSICGILLFTTPDWGYGAKLVWAYVTYLLMMTVYTGINVPYGSMLGVMTDDSNEKTVFSSFRMFFAYGGSFIALGAWEPLQNMFKGMLGSAATGTQFAMITIATCSFICFILCFFMTREHLQTTSTVSVGSDISKLLRNKPWWLLIGGALGSNLFNTVRGSVVAYFFTYIVLAGGDVSLPLFAWSIPLYAGLFLMIGEVCNMVGVALTVPVSKAFGKKTTFILSNVALAAFSVSFFFIPATTTWGLWLMVLFQVVISIFTGIISPLVWSMYADVSDYSELEYKTASTGLIFSSASMSQKFGSAIGGVVVMWVLAGAGYVQPSAGASVVQPQSALNCIWYMMSFIPAAVAVIEIIVLYFYPLTTERVRSINEKLKVQRNEN